jgi:type I restriction enzyme S subunit
MSAPIEGWELKRFDEFGTIFSGSTPSTSIPSFWNGEIVWVTPYDLSRLNTPYLHDSAKRITDRGLNGCSANILPPGSLVMSSRAPIGYVALPTVFFCTNQGCKTIRLQSDIHSEFAYYNALFHIDKVKRLGEGTTFAEISKAALSAVKLPFPKSKTEQTKIAEILSTVDRAIEQTEALIAKQERIKTGLMQDLLTRGIDEHGNLRSEATHEFKDSPLGRIPVEWDVKRLGEVVDLQVGYAFKSAWFTEDGVKLLRGENVGTGMAVWKDTQCIASNIAKLYESYRLISGDLVIGMDRTFTKEGVKVSVLAEGDAPSLLVQRVGRFISVSITQGFMRLLIQSPGYQRALLLQQKGMDIPHLSKNEILTPFVPIPKSQTEMAAISFRMMTAQDHLHKTLRAVNKLRSLKTALMQDLLTGRKRVTGLF